MLVYWRYHCGNLGVIGATGFGSEEWVGAFFLFFVFVSAKVRLKEKQGTILNVLRIMFFSYLLRGGGGRGEYGLSPHNS